MVGSASFTHSFTHSSATSEPHSCQALVSRGGTNVTCKSELGLGLLRSRPDARLDRGGRKRLEAGLTSSSSSALRLGPRLVSYTSRTERHTVWSSPTASQDQEEAKAQSYGERVWMPGRGFSYEQRDAQRGLRGAWGTKGLRLAVEVGATAATLALHSDGQDDSGSSRGGSQSPPLEVLYQQDAPVAREPAEGPASAVAGRIIRKI